MLAEMFRTSQEKIDGMIRNLRFQAMQLGLPFGERSRTYNSRLAQELGLWAESCGRGDKFHHAAFHAYFADGQNLAEPKVLLALAEQAGLDQEPAQKVLTKRSFRQPVDDDWELSRKRNITAVPTFVLGNYKLVGAQPYETLASLMQQNGVLKRADMI